MSDITPAIGSIGQGSQAWRPLRRKFHDNKMLLCDSLSSKLYIVVVEGVGTGRLKTRYRVCLDMTEIISLKLFRGRI